jgi:hypothetical protein
MGKVLRASASRKLLVRPFHSYLCCSPGMQCVVVRRCFCSYSYAILTPFSAWTAIVFFTCIRVPPPQATDQAIWVKVLQLAPLPCGTLHLQICSDKIHRRVQ